MSTVDIHPSTLGGIKRLAKSIKREQNLSHIQALDEAARAAGFQNLRHAQNVLPASAVRHPRSSSYPLYLTAYWRTNDGSSGRESLLVQMRQSWCELLRPRQLVHTRALRHFRIDADDHLETINDIDGQERAREIICAAVRTLEFMETTGLRPATGRTREFQRHTHGLPGHDHSSIWVDPETKHFVLSDEPYKDGPDFVSGRMAWARDNGLVMTTPTWPGMYVPGSSALTLVAPLDFEVRLRVMTDQLNQLREPIVSEHWDGESATYTPIFLSPLRQASGRIKRGRPHPVRSGEYRNGAVA